STNAVAGIDGAGNVDWHLQIDRGIAGTGVLCIDSAICERLIDKRRPRPQSIRECTSKVESGKSRVEIPAGTLGSRIYRDTSFSVPPEIERCWRIPLVERR